MVVITGAFLSTKVKEFLFFVLAVSGSRLDFALRPEK